MTVTPVCIVNFNVGTITRCLTHLISMLVHTEWLFWALLSLCHAFLGAVCVCECVRERDIFIHTTLFPVLWSKKSKFLIIFLWQISLKSWWPMGGELEIDTSNHVFSWWLSLRWMNFFLESVLRFCFHITSLMLSRLYTIREDYLNVSNVDLYYINNSQVYVGFSFFKIHFWYCEKSFVQKD